MKKFKKLLIFLLFSLIILLITVGIPTYQFAEYRHSEYFTYIESGGDRLPSTFNNISIISKELANTDSLTNLVNDYTNIIRGKSTDLLNLYLSVAILLGIAIISIGIILYKFKHTTISWSFMSAGTISIIIYILIYITSISVLN